jgi:hypothetical protein
VSGIDEQKWRIWIPDLAAANSFNVCSALLDFPEGRARGAEMLC